MPNYLSALAWLRAPFLWLSSATNRQRLAGARVEVIALVLTRTPEPSVLMVRSHYNGCWMPPQEGVELGESLPDALARGLLEECGIDILRPGGGYRRGFYVRDIRFLATLDLPPDRWQERPIAGNAGDSLFSRITMRKKAYWTASVIVPSRTAVHPVANATEVDDAAWMSLDRALAAVQTNRPAKADLLEGALRRGVQHLLGSEAALAWY
jgi:ADP-ribose pyrophosphatase YjhB (NUDIX family)